MNNPDNVLAYWENSSRFHGNKIAVRMNDTQLTFSELAQKSKNLAAAICGKNISGKPIAILAERTPETAILILATLYSGNYYVPINPDMPKKSAIFC